MKVKNIIHKKTFFIIIILVLIVFAVVWYARPLSFMDIMHGLDSSQITGCEARYFLSDVDNGQPKHYYKIRSFELNSDDLKKLMELLSSTIYRRQFSNIFTGGTSDTHAITLNPHALIYFSQGEELYEFSLFGQDVPAGPAQDKYDYTPWGGKDFQRRVVTFISTHGILIEES